VIETPRICMSVAPATRDDLRGLKDSTECARPDLVEVRLDAIHPCVDATEVDELVSGFKVPVIATCRTTDQGGGWTGDETARAGVLAAACRAPEVEFVDVELDASVMPALLGQYRDRLVVSHHWLAPAGGDELRRVVERIIEARPAVAKLVMAIRAAAEAVPLMAAAGQLRAAGIRTAVFGMGEASAGPRLLAASAGDVWTYARSTETAGTAAGQWSVGRLCDQLQISRWRPEFSRYAVVGDPVRQSLSPTVFNAAFAVADRPALYMPLPTSSLADAMALATAGDFAGLSVTMPFKRAALAAATTATEAARCIGAANTLRFKDGTWRAHNTDAEGLDTALRQALDPAGQRVAVLGAGGAARAAAVALGQSGASVTLFARDLERASIVAAAVGCCAARLADYARGMADVVINATPLGMASTTETPIPTASLNGEEVVLDMIYRPRVTRFVREARSRGCLVVDGLEMFLEQAAAQYSWWFGETAPDRVMRRAAIEQLDAEEESS